MDAILAAVEASGPATALRAARWGYALVNAGHILGIALLVGAILPLDLRLLGLWRGVPVATLARVLVPVAASGLALAVVMGAALFAVRAREYATLEVVWAKLALLGLGAAGALALHLRAGMWLENGRERQFAMHGALSLVCWLGALLAGRLIAFSGD